MLSDEFYTRSGAKAPYARFDASSADILHERRPHSRKSSVYGLVVFVRLFLSFAVMQAHAVMQSTKSAAGFLRFALFTAAGGFALLQRPWKEPLRLENRELLGVGLHGFLMLLQSSLFLAGVIHAGPLSALIAEHADVLVVSVLSLAVGWRGFRNVSWKGLLMMAVGILVLLVSHDTESSHGEHDPNTRTIVHFGSMYSSRHTLGILCVLGSQLVAALRRKLTQSLAPRVNGSKRLQSLSSIAATVIAVVFSALPSLQWLFPFGDGDQDSGMSFAAIFYGACALLFPYYAASLAQSHLDVLTVSKMSLLVTSLATIALGILFGSNERMWLDAIAVLLLLLGMHRVEEDDGIDAVDLDVFSGKSAVGQSAGKYFRDAAVVLLGDRESAKLLLFFVASAGILCVEMLYSLWVHNYGMMLGSEFMIFDVLALGIALVGACMSKVRSTSRCFSYGLVRADTLAGLANGVLLFFVGAFLFFEAIEHSIAVTSGRAERLLVLSLISLAVDVIGLASFGAEYFRNAGALGTPDRSSSQRGQLAEHASAADRRNPNLEGVFLTILADTLCSGGAVASAVLEGQGVSGAESIVSLLVSLCVMLLPLSLVRKCTAVFLQRSPPGMEERLESAVRGLLLIDGVIAQRNVHFWSLTAQRVVGTLCLVVREGINAQKVKEQALAVLGGAGVVDVTVQVERARTGFAERGSDVPVTTVMH